jgi:hypothetical protein
MTPEQRQVLDGLYECRGTLESFHASFKVIAERADGKADWSLATALDELLEELDTSINRLLETPDSWVAGAEGFWMAIQGPIGELEILDDDEKDLKGVEQVKRCAEHVLAQAQRLLGN